jgi:hypothetical protein
MCDDCRGEVLKKYIFEVAVVVAVQQSFKEVNSSFRTRVTYVEHVLHVVNRDERIVDVDDSDLWVIAGSAHDQAANAAKSVNSDLDGPALDDTHNHKNVRIK